MKLSEFASAKERREYLENTLTIKLDTIGSSFNEEEEHVHCENMIGGTTLPLGIAGPLTLHTESGKKDFFVPLATTEGALVASVSRGAKAIHLSGEATVQVAKSGTTRGPVYYVGSLQERKKLVDFVEKNLDLLKKEAATTSSHLTLKNIKISGTANYVFIRFSYDTQDAMGMNMVTIATSKINQLIEEKTGISCLAVAGNYDLDKKPSWLNFIETRGFAGWAEVTLKKDVIRDVLKTTPEKIFDVWLGKCMIGSAMSGSLGFNSHYANIVAAFFAATGQDLAHVVEGSMGITTTKVLPGGDLHIAVYQPALMLGTVGGGTSLKIKKEAISIIGVKKSNELAEVLVGAVLAGEISLLASIAEGSLARAHEKLGR